jgi:hypothetical protein
MTTMVLDGQKVVPTCIECGCRLQEISPNYWVHFGTHPFLLVDARGCKCNLVHHSFHLNEGLLTPDVILAGP